MEALNDLVVSGKVGVIDHNPADGVKLLDVKK